MCYETKKKLSQILKKCVTFSCPFLRWYCGVLGKKKKQIKNAIGKTTFKHAIVLYSRYAPAM